MSLTSDDKDRLLQDAVNEMHNAVEMQDQLTHNVAQIAERIELLTEQLDRSSRRIEETLFQIAKALRERNP